MKSWLLRRIQRSDRGRLFHKSLAIVLIISILPTALIAISSYIISRTYIEREVEYTHTLRLKQAVERMNEQFSRVELVVNQFAQQDLFQSQLNSESYDENFRLAQNMFGQLTLLNNADLMIKQVRLYIERKQVLITPDKGAMAITDEQDAKKYAAVLREHGDGFFWRFGFSSEPDASLSAMTLIHKLPVFGKNPYGAFIVDLDPNEMNSMLSSLNPDGSGAAFILNSGMEWVTNGVSGKQTMNPLAAALREEIRKGQAAASFRFKFDGHTYAVGQLDIPRIGLKYVTAVPLSEISLPVIFLSRLLLVSSLFGLLIAFLLSWFASNKLYQPVGKLVGLFRTKAGSAMSPDSRDELAFIEKQWMRLTHESLEFQTRYEESLPALRDAFMLQFVKGHHYAMTEQDIRERMETYGWEVHHSLFSISLIELFGLSQSGSGFSRGDEQAVAFAASNIVEEMARNRNVEVKVINFQDMSIGVFMTLPADEDRGLLKQTCLKLCQDIVHCLHTMLNVNVSVSMGKLTDQLRTIPDLTEQARQAQRYRDLEEATQILDMDGWTAVELDGFTYPVMLELEILQAVRLGEVEETLGLIERFIAELNKSSTRKFFVLQGMLQLLGSIHHTFIQSGYNLHVIDESGANLHEELTKLHDSDEILKWFRLKVIEPYAHWVEETQGMKLRQMVEKVLVVIHREYMTDISLESCADLHGTYMKKLSLAFKQVTGMNFIDYLTKVRLDKAKELLQETEDKINDIAGQVGYQPSYFTRIFKKFEGKTPGQYRDELNARKSDSVLSI